MNDRNTPPRVPFWGTFFVLLALIVFHHATRPVSGADAGARGVIKAGVEEPATVIPHLGATLAPADVEWLPHTVHHVPGTRIYYGGQLEAGELGAFLGAKGIRHVVDLAHEDKAEAILPGYAERDLVTRRGAQYYALWIEGAGDRVNGRTIMTMDSITQLGEPTFFHCRNGVHRAKVPAGRALAARGYTFGQVVRILGWGRVVGDGRYARYVASVRQACDS